MKKKYWALMLRLVISFGLIAFFMFMLSRKHGGLSIALLKYKDAFSGTSLLWLFPATLLHLVGFSLTSLRWKILLNAQGFQTRYKQLFSYYFMAAFFNTFLPSTIGGDTVRAIESKRLTGNTTTSVMVVIIERLTGLMALVLIALAAIFIKLVQNTAQHRGILIFLVLVTTGFLVMVAILHPKTSPKLLRLVKRVVPAKLFSHLEVALEAVATYYKKPAALLGALSVSMIFQFNMVVYYYLLARALHQEPNPVDFMLKVPVMIFLLMTVPAINGLGVRTASFKGLMNFPAAYALALESIDVALRIGYGLLGGIFFLFYRRPKTSSQSQVGS